MEPAFSQTLQESPLFSNNATDSILTSEIDYFKLNHQTIDLSECSAAVTFLLKYKWPTNSDVTDFAGNSVESFAAGSRSSFLTTALELVKAKFT